MTRLLQDSKHDDRRRHGRIRCATLTTRFGIIEDMSASGMRVTCKGWRKPKIGTILNVDIKHPKGIAIVECQIVWIKKVGLRKYEAAFKFIDLDPEHQRDLLAAAQESLRQMSIAQDRIDLI
tara:strand:- start:261 stop:626 length:366 start_codon:yes stop_codon:yes gene_type:complete